MNFYKHHIGDYSQATAHLSFIEDAAYSRLLRKYYSDEKPIPGTLKVALRLIGAHSREEKFAIETILNEFFLFDAAENVWRNKRADEEIARADAQAETNRRIAIEREASKKKSIGHEQSTLRDGKQGDSLNDHSQKRQPSQTPDSRLQTLKAESPESTHAAALQGVPTEAERACMLLRQSGCTKTNPSNPKLLAALNEGVTSEAIRDTYLERSDTTNPFAWAIAVTRARHGESTAAPVPKRFSQPSHAAPESKTLRILHELKALNNGS